MKSKDVIILKKILSYIAEIKEFVSGYDYEKFLNDKKTVNATVFDLSQIGELVSKLSEETLTTYNDIERRAFKWKMLKLQEV